MAAQEGFRKYTNPWRHRKTPHEMVRDPLATDCEVNRTHIFQVVRENVAILFVPGIMGSRMIDHENKRIWDPDDAEFMLRRYFILKPEGRYKLLFSNPLKVASIPTDDHKKYPKAEKRGWPGVSWNYYGRLLRSLQDWNTPLKVLLDMPVHAFGYNWLKSNEVSGMLLQDKIRTLPVHKVILVTHSMGGLVARFALGGEGGESIADKVLGVIHGAQPVHGAPAAYRRQICGFEGSGFFESRVLGKSGPDVTAVFPHSPGALQLLPSRHYRTNDGRKGWLHVQDHNNPAKYTSYPKEDPYKEIYLKNSHHDFWGMIHGEWFQPDPVNGDILDKVSTGVGEKANKLPAKFILFKKYLHQARDFHERIGEYCHPRTIQYFSRGKTTCTEVSWQVEDVSQAVIEGCDRATLKEVVKSHGGGEYTEVRWRDRDGTLGDVVPWNALPLKLRLEIEKNGKRLVQLRITQFGERGMGMANEKVCHLGDGTVPLSSSTALSIGFEGWGNCLPHLPYTYIKERAEGMLCTGPPTEAGHVEFFDNSAIRATQNAIHNLCLGWLRGEFD
jgi:hypothetical protein